MFVITKRPYVLIFILLSPVILVGNALETRRSAKADHEKAMGSGRPTVPT